MEVIKKVEGTYGQPYTSSAGRNKIPFIQRVRKRLEGAFSYGTPEFFLWKNSYARVLQTKYYLNDYVLKPKYKEIAYRQEFQQELTYVLPFAYWHHLNGTLGKTISSKYTKELYFFSDNHEERYSKRIDQEHRDSYEIPNMYHCFTVSFDKWAQVPLKQHYKNNVFEFEKPLLVIANKYNTEWGNGPINFFSLPMLDRILATFSTKYQIVYNRPSPDYIVMDNSDILELKEADFIRKNYPEVILAEDLFQENSWQLNNYNHFQLLLYANCERFLSVHGGAAALASYFGGKNIILSRRGHEHKCNEFKTIFPALSGAEIYHARNEAEVLQFLQQHY